MASSGARRETRNACRRISREWPAALAAAAAALEECGDALPGPSGKQPRQHLSRPRKPQRAAALQAAPQPAPLAGAAKLPPEPKSTRRPRKWERGRAPLPGDVAADFWVPEEAARAALERGLVGSALISAALTESSTSADSDSGRDETVPFPPPAASRRSQGGSLMQTLQAVLEAGEWPAAAPAPTPAPEPQLQQPQPQQQQVAAFQPPAPAPLPLRPAAQEEEAFQPALIPTTTAPASRAVSLLPEELGWEVVTDPDSWDLVSLEDAFE